MAPTHSSPYVLACHPLNVVGGRGANSRVVRNPSFATLFGLTKAFDPVESELIYRKLQQYGRVAGKQSRKVHCSLLQLLVLEDRFRRL